MLLYEDITSKHLNCLEPILCEVVIESYEGDYADETDFDQITKEPIKFGCYHGFGNAILKNGCTYEGQFYQGIFHGNGVLTWSDGTIYDGCFHYGIVSFVFHQIVCQHFSS